MCQRCFPSVALAMSAAYRWTTSNLRETANSACLSGWPWSFAVYPPSYSPLVLSRCWRKIPPPTVTWCGYLEAARLDWSNLCKGHSRKLISCASLHSAWWTYIGCAFLTMQSTSDAPFRYQSQHRFFDLSFLQVKIASGKFLKNTDK